MQHKTYAKLGGNLTYACQRLAEGINAIGVVAVLYRGKTTEAEIAMTFARELKIDAEDFRKLTGTILENSYAASLSIADRPCEMLAEATGSECVMLFVIRKDGAIQVKVSKPQSNEFVAAFALQISNSFNAMN